MNWRGWWWVRNLQAGFGNWFNRDLYSASEVIHNLTISLLASDLVRTFPRRAGYRNDMLSFGGSLVHRQIRLQVQDDLQQSGDWCWLIIYDCDHHFLNTTTTADVSCLFWKAGSYQPWTGNSWDQRDESWIRGGTIKHSFAAVLALLSPLQCTRPFPCPVGTFSVDSGLGGALFAHDEVVDCERALDILKASFRVLRRSNRYTRGSFHVTLTVRSRFLPSECPRSRR